MPVRSVVIQLQAGVGQAILPDHRKMVPGIQYVVDWDTFQKISNGARQNVIQVVSVNSDSSTTGSFVPAQSSTNINAGISLSTILTTTSTTPIAYNLAGFAAQGYDGNGAIGVGPTVSGATINNVLTGPAGERYMYVFNNNVTASGGQVLVWADESNRFVTVTRPTYTIVQDGQGTDYQWATNVNGVVGTKQGRFAGVALSTFSGSSYGWIQIAGVCPSVAVTGTVTTGATVAVAASGVAKTQAASAASVGSNNIVTGTALANNVFGTVLASGTTSGGYYVVDIRGAKAKKPYVRVLNKN